VPTDEESRPDPPPPHLSRPSLLTTRWGASGGEVGDDVVVPGEELGRRWSCFFGSRRRILCWVLFFTELFFYPRRRALRREPKGWLLPNIFTHSEGPISCSACISFLTKMKESSFPKLQNTKASPFKYIID
jgi:hypothetical protein